jgi:iron complex outermembrane recepter protein
VRRWRAALKALLSGTNLSVKTTEDGAIAVGFFGDAIGATGYGVKPILVVQGDARPLESNGPDRQVAPSGSLQAPETARLEEILVTARKQSEPLQDVPISITALSAETLQRSGAESLADIARAVPGLNVVSVGPGQNQIIIRGVSSSGGSPTVGYYIDDTPIQSNGNLAGSAMDPALLDLERVEVLRGPQGTLYGASSMGGTVKYVTHQPDLTAAQATVKSSLSDTDGGGFNYQVSSVMNEPLIAGIVALRAMTFYGHQDGYIDRYPIDPYNYVESLNGPVTKNVNTDETYGLRVELKIKPSDSLSITPAIWIQRTNLGAPFTFDDPPGNFDHPIQARDVDEPITDKLGLVSLTMEGDLQGVHLTSSTAYRDRWFDAFEDDSKVTYYFNSPVPQSYVYASPFENYFANHDFTEEIRGSGSVGVIHAVMGLFYAHQDNYTFNNQPILPGYNAAFGTPFGDQTFFFGTDSNQIEQKALFGEINVDITQKLQGTLGARVFTIAQRDFTTGTGVFNGGYSASGASSKDSGTNPKFELSYKLSPDILTYATAAKGFREGGPISGFPANICNADLAALGLSAAPSSYSADTLWSYEIGAKTAWLDHRLTVNAGIYYIDWTNIQQLISLPTCGVAFTGNFGTASSEGGEFEIRYEPSSAVILTLGAAYNEAKLLSTVAGAQGQKGDTLENAPRWMGSASAEYHREFDGSTSGFARLDANTTSYQYNNFDPTSIYYKRAGYSLANVRVGSKREAWEGSLFMDNVLNKRAETALPLSYAIDLPSTRRVSLNRPRTVGLEVQYDF